MKTIGSYFPAKSKDINMNLSSIDRRQVKPNDIIIIDDSSADEDTEECTVVNKTAHDLNIPSKRRIHDISDEGNMEPSTENPFMQFAHGLGASESSYFSASATLPTSTKTETKQIMKTNISRNRTDSSSRKDVKMRRKRKESTDVENFASKSEEELIACMQKWQSMAIQDAPIEIRRFQVLVAARLHAQSQEKVVRKAMKALHEYFHQSSDKLHGAFLSCESLSKADPETISKIISSVLFANVKSKHIIQAAREVKSTFHGIVPTSLHGLKSITGVGPHLAELLFYVNSPNSFAKIESLKG
jgi:endonuclease III